MTCLRRIIVATVCLFVFFSVEVQAAGRQQMLTAPIVYVAQDGSGDFNCDGIQDQIEINEALDFVAANSEFSTVFLKGPNTYWIDSPVIISANTTLEGDAAAAIKLVADAGWVRFKPLIGQKGTVYAPDLGDPGVSTGNITIRGFEIDGNKDNQSGIPDGDSFYTLIQLQNCYEITVNDMFLHSNTNDAIRMTHDVPAVDVDSRFFNLRIHDNGHSGIYIIGVDNFQIFNNNITSSRTDAGIRPQYCNRFEIFNNIIGNNPDRPSSGGSPIQIEADGAYPLDSAEIFNNYLYGDHYWHGIWLNHEQGAGALYTHQNVHIHHNIITRYRRSGIGIYGFNNTLIENNVIAENRDGGVVFYAGDPGDTTLTGFSTILKNNIVVGNSGYGLDNRQSDIHSFVSDYNCISGNSAGHYHGASSVSDIHTDPLFIAEDTYNILSNAWAAAEISGDWASSLGALEAWLAYHLQSEGGHWDGWQWVADSQTSPCVDTGDPDCDFVNELFPNGDRINIGAFGNTAEASKAATAPSHFEGEFGQVPGKIHLTSVYPNPFNPRTEVAFYLPETRRIRIVVYDVQGHSQATIAQGEYGKGNHRVTWSGCDDYGRDLPTGMYLLRLDSGDQVESGKLMLVR